ncbi:MAG: hypothetical protein QW101_07280 [Ignisphaera sp.]|uniref:Uncharacterized protein n=1 Tax=Ignisphaera aggregans TaxID=334771 RepID=A0A7J3MY83_9CREN
MRLKSVLCRVIGQSSIPTLLPRHIVAPIALCKHLKEVDVNKLPKDVIEMLKNRGYSIIDDPAKALEIIGVSLAENEYVKIFIVEY